MLDGLFFYQQMLSYFLLWSYQSFLGICLITRLYNLNNAMESLGYLEAVCTLAIYTITYVQSIYDTLENSNISTWAYPNRFDSVCPLNKKYLAINQLSGARQTVKSFKHQKKIIEAFLERSDGPICHFDFHHRSVEAHVHLSSHSSCISANFFNLSYTTISTALSTRSTL
jgi:hypothetical protein